MIDRWPDGEDLLALTGEWTGPRTRIRDAGILCAAAARPHAQMVGRRVYATSVDQAAALLHGIVQWRPLDLWNAGLAWAAARALLIRVDIRLAMPAAERMKLTDEIMDGAVDSVEEIALRLSPYLQVIE